MKETILITGANSFIAQHLIPLLQDKYNIKLLSRYPKAANEYKWNIEEKYIDPNALEHIDYIIHLAGSKLNDGTPLTESRKALVYNSRIGAANLLLEKLKANKQTIKSFVSASAIGYYGYTDNTLSIDENGDMGTGFAAQLSADWESAADAFKAQGIALKVAKIRVSLVLGNEGGVFPQFVTMVKQNPAIIQNNQNASIPWNHVSDMAGIFAFAITNQLDGVYNSVAPEAISQQDLFIQIANQLYNKQYPLKKFEGQHLIAQKIMDEGYTFKYPTIQSAVQQLINN